MTTSEFVFTDKQVEFYNTMVMDEPQSITLEELAQLKENASGVYNDTGIVGSLDIDRDVCQEVPLTCCGGKARYDNVLDADSYRAFAVCDACNKAFEF